MKICSNCNKEKNENEFCKDTNQCKECKNIKNKIYNEIHKSELKEYSKKYYIDNKNDINKKHKEYYNKNLIIISKRHYKYRNEHKDILKSIDIICLNCGKKSKAYKNSIGKFCSKSCNAKYRKGVLSPVWQGGISYGEYCSKFNKEFKNRVRAFFDYQCFMCGKDEEENISKIRGIVNLSVHHVCYNKRACCDDTPRYFVPLCIKHHIQTNHNRNRWEEMFKRCLIEMYDGRSFYTKEEYNKIFNEKEL